MSQEHPIVMILGWRSGSSSLTKELYEKGYPRTPPLDVRPMEGHQPGRDITKILRSNRSMRRCWPIFR